LRKRKPVLLVDYNSSTSHEAIELLKGKNVEFAEYDINKLKTSCCAELPTTITPSVFAPEGIFKGLEGVVHYVSIERKDVPFESESAYW
jgi:hypothetical protein